VFTSLRNWLRPRALVAFFVLAYAICAAAFLSYVAFPGLPFLVLKAIWWAGVFSPTISALTMAGLIGGPAEIRRLLDGFTRWKIGWQWYLAVSILVLGPLAVAGVYIALGNAPGGLPAGWTVWNFLGALVFTLCAGPLAEEAGWRGFALPRLQGRFSALNASLLLGLLWAFWHLPQYQLPDNGMIPFPIFLPICVALAILFTWFYNNTGGSLVATVLAHLCFNFSGAWLAGYLGLAPAMLLNIAGGAGILVLVIVVIVFAGAPYLSRKPLDQLPFRRVAAAAAKP